MMGGVKGDGGREELSIRISAWLEHMLGTRGRQPGKENREAYQRELGVEKIESMGKVQSLSICWIIGRCCEGQVKYRDIECQ